MWKAELTDSLIRKEYLASSHCQTLVRFRLSFFLENLQLLTSITSRRLLGLYHVKSPRINDHLVNAVFCRLVVSSCKLYIHIHRAPQHFF